MRVTYSVQVCRGFLARSLLAVLVVVLSAGVAGAEEPLSAAVTPVVTSLAIDPVSPTTVYAGTGGSGVFKTTDGGASWTPANEGLGNTSVGSVGIAGPAVLVLAGGAIYRSTDQAASWSKVGSLEGRTISSLATDPAGPAFASGSITYNEGLECTFFVRSCDGALLRSSFGGSSWSRRALMSGRATALALSGTSSIMYAGVPPGRTGPYFQPPGIFKSTDSGRNWTRKSEGLPEDGRPTSIVFSAGSPSTAFAIVDSRVFRTTNGGSNWSASDVGLTSAANVLAIDPVSPSTVYAGAREGVFRTVDGGDTWSEVLGATAVSALAINPSDPSTIYAGSGNRIFKTVDGGATWALVFVSAPGTCTATATSLCLNGGRFEVRVTWRSRDGRSGEGQAAAVTTNTGYFWFFSSANVELMVKVIDGTPVNGHFWVFAGALSDVEYTLTVGDTLTGDVRSYFNPLGQLSSFASTSAFPGTGESGADTIADSAVSPISATAYLGQVEACAAGPAALCLNGGRFKVDVAWRTTDGRSGEGQAAPLTADTGYFWFFNDTNVELVIKVLDGRPVNGHYWVFYGALSNVAYTITVTDTQTGILKTYDNPQGTLASVADTNAF